MILFMMCMFHSSHYNRLSKLQCVDIFYVHTRIFANKLCENPNTISMLILHNCCGTNCEHVVPCVAQNDSTV